MKLARVVRLAGDSRSVTAGYGYRQQTREPRCSTEVSSRHEITCSGSANGLASFDPQATAVGIRGTAGAVGTPGAVGRAETGLSSLSRLSCWPKRERVYLVCSVCLVQWVG